MKVLIVGATSAIAEATARLFAARGDRLYLVARNPEKLAAVSADLQVRGASWVGSMVLDACDTGRHQEMLNAAVDGLDGLDIVLIAHGTLPDQRQAQQSYPAALQVLEAALKDTDILVGLLILRLEPKKYHNPLNLIAR